MKRTKHRILLTIILLVASFSVFSASIGEAVTLRLVGYIPERTTFAAADDGSFLIASNANNFTYSVEHSSDNRTLTVVAR